MNRLYPDAFGARNRWVTARRGPKNAVDAGKAYAAIWETEPGAGGAAMATATVFLTNRECPFRCVMCDLWKNTLDDRVPRGAIAAQIRGALAELPPARQIKLYNAGSFFDPAAIPPEDYAEIADAVAGFERVIVECHPKLVGRLTTQFQKLLAGRLEVAIGLETVHRETLARLNKAFTVEDFADAAAFLTSNHMDLRVFLLLRPPFMNERDGIFWARKSLDFAFAQGASVCCVIPTRGGNGAMETLAENGDFSPPSLRSLETVMEYGLQKNAGRVFADLWDIDAFFDCECSPARAARLAEMNCAQIVPKPIVCPRCFPENLPA